MKHQYSGGFGEVVVRPLEEGDIESLRVWRNEPSNTRYLSKVPFITPEMQKKWYENYLANDEELQFAICFKDSGELIGSAALYDISLIDGESGKHVSMADLRQAAEEKEAAYIGAASERVSGMRAELGKIMIGAPDAHGKHAGVSAVRAMVEIAFIYMGLRELQLHVYVDNVPAVKVYRQAGFSVCDKHAAEDGREEYLMCIEKSAYAAERDGDLSHR